MIANLGSGSCKYQKNLRGATLLKISTGRRSVNDDKLSRRLELVGSLRSATPKSPRRFRIGFADDLFSESRSISAKHTHDSNIESGSEPKLESEQNILTEISRADLAVGLAAFAGLTLGYLIGRRRK